MPEGLLESVVAIARAAGNAALELYDGSGEVEYKADLSPLTLADKAAHRSIVAGLRDVTPDVPVLSEESAAAEVADRRRWHEFWLVDPLDGSKEFIKRTGEFTVNIARVQGSELELGVVHVPVSRVTYLAARGGGAWVERPGEDRRPIRTRPADLERLVVVASKDHAGPRVEALLERLPSSEVTSMGSSLKFCLIAEGRADFYPRFVPTMEWDTGAAQCVLEVAGGGVCGLDGRRLAYNKDDLRNPPIVAFGDPALPWRGWMEEL